LNIYGLLRPGLSVLYDKMQGKQLQNQLVWVSKALVDELTWFTDHVERSMGVHMLESVEWSYDSRLDLLLFTDACLFSLGFWCPALSAGFQCPLNDGGHCGIFFYEALAVVSALQWALTSLASPPRRIAIFTDSSNTVDLFHMLRAQPCYNPLLLTSVDLLLRHGHQLRVFHVTSEDNAVADSLSRLHGDLALSIVPDLSISTFIPPPIGLGAVRT
jgi:hypothetical protein